MMYVRTQQTELELKRLAGKMTECVQCLGKPGSNNNSMCLFAIHVKYNRVDMCLFVGMYIRVDHKNKMRIIIRLNCTKHLKNEQSRERERESVCVFDMFFSSP